MNRKFNNDLERQEAKRVQKSKRSRSLKDNYPVFKNGFFNIEDKTPWGFNWVLGYCEQPVNFVGR